MASGANKLPCLDRLECEDLHEIMLVGHSYGAALPLARAIGLMMQRGVRGTSILVTSQPTTSYDPTRREDSKQGRDVPRVPARPCP